MVLLTTKAKTLLLGKSDQTRQTVLWPLYSFNVIPIQLISSIYELFFHLAETDSEKEKGTYYTPYHLVEMLMDEVLSWEGNYAATRILDPACGSGVFLVAINKEGEISEYPTYLTKLLGIKDEEYESSHTRSLDRTRITLHHLFFDFAA